MEFLERIEENLTKQRETRWTLIHGMLDEHFKEMNVNWWTATRHDITDYQHFKNLFKAKYWYESTQNIVCDNLCNGKFDPTRGQTLIAYFLGKVCLARNLEPRMPEESLVTKLSYHFEQGIERARLPVSYTHLVESPSTNCRSSL